MTGRIVIFMLLLSLALVSCGDGISDTTPPPCPVPETRVEDNDCTTASVVAAVCSKYCFDSLRNQLNGLGRSDFTDALRVWIDAVERPFENALVRHHDQFCASQSDVSEDIFQIADLDNPPLPVFSDTPIAALRGYWWYNIRVIIRDDGTVGCSASSVRSETNSIDLASGMAFPLITGPGGYHVCD